MQHKESFMRRLVARLTRKQLDKPTTPARPFQAISIFRGVHSCQMARKFSEHRFLARDAPSLPLTGCTMPERCECRFIRHKDRRSDQRRLVDFGASPRAYKGRERRVTPGRRASDRQE